MIGSIRIMLVVVAILVYCPSADTNRVSSLLDTSECSKDPTILTPILNSLFSLRQMMNKKQRRRLHKKKTGDAARPSGYRLWMVEDGPTLADPKTTIPTIVVTQKEE